MLTGSAFGETADMGFGFLMDLIEIHPEQLGEAVSFRWEDLDTLETEETRLTAARTVRILRELSRTGESPTLREMVQPRFRC